jgi:site-specific recombinase XerC
MLKYSPTILGGHINSYAKTKNIRAVQLLLGHTKVDNTIRYLGVELEDALLLSESTDC